MATCCCAPGQASGWTHDALRNHDDARDRSPPVVLPGCGAGVEQGPAKLDRCSLRLFPGRVGLLRIVLDGLAVQRVALVELDDDLRHPAVAAPDGVGTEHVSLVGLDERQVSPPSTPATPVPEIARLKKQETLLDASGRTVKTINHTCTGIVGSSPSRHLSG